MRGSLIVLVGLLWIGAESLGAEPTEYISLSAGGTMSSGLQIQIDLDTGLATKRTMARGSLAPGERPNWLETKKQLSPDTVLSLKQTIRASLNEGLRSKACDDADQAAKARGTSPLALHPPSIDSMITLDVRLEGRSGSAPERGCESAAFNRLWDAAYSAASPEGAS
jgi:hypothetical protein